MSLVGWGTEGEMSLFWLFGGCVEEWGFSLVGTVFDSALTCCSGIVLYIIGTFIAIVFVGKVFDSALIVVIVGEYKKKYSA